ncbi:MAG TPA: hypothetical protein VEF53_17825 [Patescibacteria group bacterium]|nr:hypothetical protein [Patescibacteria group bacterium]
MTNNSYNAFCYNNKDHDFNVENVDKLVLKDNIILVEDELLRKTFYIRRKNWDKLCEIVSRTHNSKLKVINALIEYAFENLVIE